MLEKEIVNRCSSYIIKHFTGTKKTKSKHEFIIDHEVGFDYGLADILLFLLSKDSIKKRKKQSLIKPILNSYTLFVYLKTPANKQLSIEDFINLLSIKSEYKLKYLRNNSIRFLTMNNYFRKIDKDKYIKNNEYINPLFKLFAFEMKLSDWKNGLNQAIRYKSYADKSYLGLWNKHINSALREEELFRKHNIGLISVGDKEDSTVEIKPQDNKELKQFNKYLAAEYAFHKYLLHA